MLRNTSHLCITFLLFLDHLVNLAATNTLLNSRHYLTVFAFTPVFYTKAWTRSSSYFFSTYQFVFSRRSLLGGSLSPPSESEDCGVSIARGSYWYGSTVASAPSVVSSHESELSKSEQAREEADSSELTLVSRSLSIPRTYCHCSKRSRDDVERKPRPKPETRWRPNVRLS